MKFVCRFHCTQISKQSETGYDRHNPPIIGRWVRNETVALILEVVLGP